MIQYTTPAVSLGVVIGSLAVMVLAITSLDTKRFAAASSVLHMQICILGLIAVCASTLIVGALLQLVAHSWIAVLLFAHVGEVYEVNGSRVSRGHVHTSRSSSIMLLIVLANAGFPSTPSYTAEFLMAGYGGVLGILSITVLCTTLGGVLTVVGLLHWVAGSAGRSRISPGVHMHSQGLGVLTLFGVSTLGMALQPTTQSAYALWCIVVA